MGERRSIPADIATGLRIGMYLAVVWCVVAVLAYFASGGTRFEQLGISLPAALAGYAVAGLVCGAVWAAGRPLARSWWGAAVLGFLVAIPGCVVLFSVVAPGADWADLAKLSLLTSAAFGPATGIILRWDSREPR
jgi:hypothetical protein